MKHLNFFSKSGSQSCSHRVVTLALTVGSPSAHRRGAMLRLLSVLVLIFTFGIGQMWGAIAAGTYELCTSTSDLVATGHYIIASSKSDGSAYAIANTSKTSNRATVDVTVSSEKITVAANSTVMTFTLGGDNTNGWTFATDNYGGTAGYLKATSSTSNELKVVSGNPDNNAKWAISFSSGLAKPVAKGTNSRKYMKYNYNNGTPIFNCYNSSGSESLYIYKLSACTSITPTLSYTSTNLTIGGGNSSSPTLNKGGSSGAVTWSSDDAGVATVNSSGVVTPVGTGTCNITASIAAAGGKCAGEVSVEFTVKRTITYYIGSTSYTVGGIDGETLVSTLPANPSSCDGVNYPYFYGWKNGSISGSTATPPAILTTETVSSSSAANTYYAVFTDVEAADYSTTYTSNVTGVSGVTVNIGSNSYDGKKVGSQSTAGGSITVSCPIGTTAIAVHAYSWNNADNKTITPSASGITFTPTSGTLRANSGVTGSGPFTLSTANWNNNYFLFEFDKALTAATNVTLTLNNRGIFWGINAVSGNSEDAHYLTNCCTELGSIKGSVLLTKSSNSVTVKGWTYTQGSAAAESNISTYDVYLYSSADDYTTPVTQTCAYNAKGTGVTFTGLSNANTYKLKIGATGNTNYCDITPVQVTTIDGSSAETFQLPCVAAGLSYGTSPVVKSFGNDDFTNALTNSHGLTVSYSVLNADPSGCVTVNGSGLVHIVSAGTATIKATSAEQTVNNVKYCEGEASYSLTVNKLNITPSVLYASTSLTAGGTSASPTITGNTGNGGVTYSSSNTDVATVDASTGVVTAKAAGSATITASIAATTNYNAGSATANFTISAASQCATPTFSVATGTYNENKSVELGCLTEGATIYYTTDGSDPTTSETRKTYSSAFSIGVTTTIRAYAEKSGMTASEEGSATITIKCAAPTFSPDEGSFTSAQNVTLATTYGDEIYYTTNDDDPATNGTKYTGAIAVSTTNTTIKAIAKKTNCANSDLATATYTIKCATPTITPGTGDVTTGQEITLSCETADATIYYTIGDNPTDPTTASTPYDPENKPVVSAATTIKAIAVKTGWSNSDVASATYAMKYTVTLNAGTGTCASSVTQASHGESVTLPDATIAVTGWSFAGWKAESAVTTETNVKPSFVDKTYTPTGDITLYAVYEKESEGTAVDELDCAFTTVTSTSYTEWSGKSSSASSAVYAGKTTTNNNQDFIQLKGADNTGIISTTSGGKAKKVTVTWHSNQTSTGDNYVLQVYGKNEAYSATSDLYSAQSATQGTSLGTIAATSATQLSITGDYEYIGLRGSKSALYFTEIDIEWSTTIKKYYSNPSDKVTLTYDANYATAGSAPVAESGITIGDKVTVAVKPAELAKTGYTFGGWNTKAEGDGTNYAAGIDEITMNDNTTLYAKWTINKHTVAVSAVANGTITATPTGASAITEGNNNTEVAYGTVVTLSPTNDEHYSFGDWVVTAGGNTVEVTNNTFEMPDADVTVSAVFNENAYRTVKFYNNGAQIGENQKVYVGEAPVAETAVYDACLGESNLFYGWATESWDNTIDASTLAGKTVITGNMPNVESTDPETIEYYAVWAAGTPSTTVFKRATSLSELTDGTEVIITTAYYETVSSVKNNRLLKGDALNSKTLVAPSDEQLTITNEQRSSYVWTLGKSNSNYTLTQGSSKLGVATLGGDVSLTNTNSTWQIAKYDHATYTQYQNCFVLYQENSEDAEKDYYLEFGNQSKWVTYSTNTDSYSWVAQYVYVPTMVAGTDFRTNCCTLKPVTGLNAVVKNATTVTLNWTKPESTDGISKYQVLDSDDNVLVDNITDVNATSVDVEGLISCETYVLRVVSYSSACSVASSTVETTPSASTKTVTFNYAGGSGATESISTTCSETSITLPTPNDWANYNFKGWYNGDTKIGDAGASYSPSDNITLVAHWAQLFTVSYELAGATNIDEIASAQYEEGATVTLTDQVPNKGIMATFKAWSFSPNVTMVDETHFTMPSSDVTITATYNGVGAGKWILVDDADEVTAGSYIIIAAASSNVAMSTTQNTNNRGLQSISKSNDKSILTYETAPAIFRVEEGNKTNTVAFYDGTGYIYAASSSANQLKTETNLSNNSSWSVAVNESGEATITAQGSYTHNLLQYNSNSSLFSAYDNAQTNGKPALYKFYENVPTVTYYSNTGGDELDGFPKEKRTVKNELTDKYEATVIDGPNRPHFTFAGWYDNEDGTGDAYTGTIEVDGDNLDLYAKWDAAPVHHITYNTSGSTGATPTDAADYYEGDVVTLASGSGLSNAGYFFDGWNVTYIDGGSAVQTVLVEEGKFTMPNYDVTATSKWAPKSDDKWLLVTSEGMLEADGEYAIVAANADGGKYYAMSKTQNTNNRGVAEVEFDGDNLVGSSSMAIFTLEAGTVDDTWAFYDPANTGYIYAASSSKNYLQTQEDNDENGSWNIDFTSGTAITAQGTYTHNQLKYNSGSDIFSCYTGGQGAVKLYKKKAVVRVEDDMNVSTIAAGADVIIESGATLTVNSAKEINDLTVKAGGEVVLSTNALTVVGTFTIKSTMASGTSGQLNGATASNFAANGPAYIDITLGKNGTNQQWHAFTVPFEVDVMSGIYNLDNEKLTNEVNYAIMEYLGDVRATGAYGWKKIRTTLVPGTFYIMATDGYRTTYRFKKKAGAALVAQNSKQLYKFEESGNGVQGTDNGWNGVGNPNLFYGKVGFDVQVLNPTSYTFEDYDANQQNFVVGTPFFIQAENNGTMTMTAPIATDDPDKFYAPRRTQAKGIEKVKVIFGNEVYTDRLTISASEDALNTYETGKDLVKMTMTNTPSVAQIFGKAYGFNLCRVYAPLSNDQAVYDLSLYAPQAGTYSIAVPNDVDATIYLTYEGAIIWNLSMGAYEIELAKGTTNGYGLLLQAKAPQVVTGVDEVDAETGVQKIIIDEHVFILRGGQLFGIDGKAVK